MLALARARLERAGLAQLQRAPGRHLRSAGRAKTFDVVVIHQVLHFLDDGARAIREAARVLRPGGRLLIVDFAPHDLEFLRDEHAHRRLGFAPETVSQWMTRGRARRRAASHASRPAGTGKITVSLWLGRDPRRAVARRGRSDDAKSDIRARAGHVRQLRRIRVSFEFFPPKTDEMESTLWETIERLAPLRPNFVSVTYGAGGSTRERTHATVKRILAETSLTPAAHLTCVGATPRRSRLRHPRLPRTPACATSWRCAAIRPAASATATRRIRTATSNGADLVAGIKRLADFEVSVSAYPEKHPDSQRRSKPTSTC